MKAAYAVRETTCYECKEVIPVGERRLDDAMRLGKFITRLHYHPACAWVRWERWWRDNEGRKSPMIRQGRKSELSIEERAVRNAALNALRGICNHWIPKLNVMSSIQDLDLEEQRRYMNFVMLFQKHTAVLERVGGIPERYASLRLPMITVKEVKIPETQSATVSSADGDV